MADANFDIRQFGIKEVADVRFYKVGDIEVDTTTGKVVYTGATEPTAVLALDTLKVSTLEFTAEQAEARGGKGNPPLIIWDYGREVNVTLEDATMSIDSLEVMFGEKIAGSANTIISINAQKFPGTYAIVGKTYARDIDGTDRTTKLNNTRGTELPSTGGMGTTILYIGGSILVILAAVLLITKRRMNAED